MKSDLCDLAIAAPVETRLKASRISLALADAKDRDRIYEIRHQIYGLDLGQHSGNGEGRLRDALDSSNTYLVAKIGAEIAGFVSITPPTAPSYSIDKYFPRASLPFRFSDKLYEIRLLTVLRKHRGRELATALMYGAFRWVESHGGAQIVAIGRREILDLYLRTGLECMPARTRFVPGLKEPWPSWLIASKPQQTGVFFSPFANLRHASMVAHFSKQSEKSSILLKRVAG